MFEQLRTADPSAASVFLEHLILQKRSDVRVYWRSLPCSKCLSLIFQDRRIHVEFANSCLDQLFNYLADDAISKLWRAKGRYVKTLIPHSANLEPVSGYQKSTAQTSFLSYFVSTTPDSEHKRARLKTILFLQASTLLDLEVILLRFKKHPGIFSLEIALIEGKVPNTTPSSPTILNSVSRSSANTSLHSRFLSMTYTTSPPRKRTVRSVDK